MEPSFRGGMVNRVAELLAHHASAEAPAPRPLSWQSTRRAFRIAGHGLVDAWLREPHLRLHTYAAACVLIAGYACRLSRAEWMWICFAIGLVLFAEVMNTAIERTVDLAVGLRPDPLARYVKDVAAGCVLVAVIIAVTVGLMTFLPHLH